MILETIISGCDIWDIIVWNCDKEGQHLAALPILVFVVFLAMWSEELCYSLDRFQP